MQLVSAEDIATFERLVEKHQALVAGTVGRMLGSNSEVKDVAQQVFVRVWKSAKRYVRARSPPRGCLRSPAIWFSTNSAGENVIPITPLQDEPEGEEMQLKDERGSRPDAAFLEANCTARSMRRSPSFRKPNGWPSCSAVTRS